MGNSKSRLLIAYDLLKPNYTPDDYKKLYAELDSIGAKRIQDSVWAVRTDADAFDVFDRLQRYIYRTDRLLVIRVNGFRSRGAINKLSRI
jgi:CRISPR/Cas system-associated endoribonuclease Cas2